MRVFHLLVASAAALMPLDASAAGRPIVLELFTSEGCSSCPPAEALLTRLAKRQDLLALSFHVTYWNSLGWRDAYSFEAATERQNAYAARLNDDGNYTPQMVVDGRRGMVGSEDVEIADAIIEARRQAAQSIPVDVSRPDAPSGKTVAISIGKGSGRGQVLLIGFDPSHRTKIGRGEHRGVTLTETNIVRSIRRIADYAGREVQIEVPVGAGDAFAVVVQAADGRILGAARS